MFHKKKYIKQYNFFLKNIFYTFIKTYVPKLSASSTLSGNCRLWVSGRASASTPETMDAIPNMIIGKGRYTFFCKIQRNL